MNGCQTAEETCVETTRKHVSFSQIQTYQMCPQKYYYNYILRVPVEAEPEALVLGRHIHYAVAEYYRHWQKNGSRMPLEGLQSAFVEGWREEPANIAWKNGNTRESLQDLAFAMLDIFHAAREPGEVIAVESKFDVPLFDPETGEVLSQTLAGTVDLVERGEDGKITLVELKTSGKAYSPGQIEYSHQPSLYAYALEQMELIEPGAETRVRYDILTKTKQPKLQQLETTRTPKDIHKSLHLTKEILRAIELQVFYRNNGYQCADCQFRAICE